MLASESACISSDVGACAVSACKAVCQNSILVSEFDEVVTAFSGSKDHDLDLEVID